MTFLGADVEQVRGLAERMGRRAEVLATSIDVLEGAVLGVAWMGPDADRMRQTWIGSVRPQVDLATAHLARRAVELAENAEQQDAASAADGGPLLQSSAEIPGPAVAEAAWHVDAAPGEGPGSIGVENEGSRDGEYFETPPDPDGTIDGPTPYPGVGLGPPVEGEDAETPLPPQWAPSDPGAGEWNTRVPMDEDWDTLRLAREMIFGGRFTGKGAASDNLQHYINGTGEDKKIDVDGMLTEVPTFGRAVEKQDLELVERAIARAQAEDADGPVTFPVNTSWVSSGAPKEESEEYYYATASFDFNQTGTVTVYPPTEEGGEWTYELETSVNVRDRYNWDTGKGVNLDVPVWAPGYEDEIFVPDEQMQGLHQSGLAREYNLVGESSVTTRTGP